MKLSYSDTGFVLRVVDSGEADKVVGILSQEHGLGTYMAKGTRRPASKKSSHLDLFNLIKFSVGRGESPRFLNQVEAVNFFPGIKANLMKVRLAMTFSEILVNTLPIDEDDPEMFLSLRSFLDGLEKAKDKKEINELSRRFGLYLLRHLGYPPPKSPETDDLSAYFEAIMGRKIISKDIK